MGRRSTGTTPGGKESRFPGFDVLSESDHWDQVTAGVVMARLSLPDPLRFFELGEEAIARPLLDHLLDQWNEPRVPVLETIDARLTERETDGWHYSDLPEDGEAWRASLRNLDADAQAGHNQGFAECSRPAQAALIQAVQDADDGGWRGLRADWIWSLWTRYACTAFYSHPWAWNEIGFPGPAYPRGYKNSGLDAREPFEVADARPSDPTRITS